MPTYPAARAVARPRLIRNAGGFAGVSVPANPTASESRQPVDEEFESDEFSDELDEIDEEEVLDEEDVDLEGDIDEDDVETTLEDEDEVVLLEDEEPDSDEVEASLDQILEEKVGVRAGLDEDEDEDDFDEGYPVEDRTAGLGVAPKRPGEFTCRSCFLVKHPSQLADAARMLCRDCV